MLLLGGPGVATGSAIRGRGNHNQCIEHFWGDLWHGSTNAYYSLFSFLESEGITEPDNNMHIWAMHYIYLPQLNRHLELFCSRWNNHAIRTDGHRTQTFVQGCLALQGHWEQFKTLLQFQLLMKKVCWNGPWGRGSACSRTCLWIGQCLDATTTAECGSHGWCKTWLGSGPTPGHNCFHSEFVDPRDLDKKKKEKKDRSGRRSLELFFFLFGKKD